MPTAILWPLMAFASAVAVALLFTVCGDRFRAWLQSRIDTQAERKLALTPDEVFEAAIRDWDGQ